MTGRFIVFDGVEGAGKSTAMRAVAQVLESQGQAFLTTREPGGTAFAEQIRDLALSAPAEGVAGMTELLLMFAARAQHIEKLIKPALAQGQWVLSDRFTDASYAYQGVARNLGRAKVEALEALVQDDFRPDLVLLFDLEPEIGLARTRGRTNNNRLDQESLTFYQKAREGFAERAAATPARYRRIDASQSPEGVLDQVMAALT